MRHQWRLRRTFQEHLDGQRRWDRAYQLLVQWAQASDTPPSAPNLSHRLVLNSAIVNNSSEVTHARSDLCPGLDPAPNTDPDH
jgi:hypothetical protein